MLHAHVCQSRWWSEECQREDGGRHARETMRPTVMEALKSDGPIAYLHDHICDAHLDPTTRCPDPPAHIAHVARIIGLPGQRKDLEDGRLF